MLNATTKVASSVLLKEMRSAFMHITLQFDQTL